MTKLLRLTLIASVVAINLAGLGIRAGAPPAKGEHSCEFRLAEADAGDTLEPHVVPGTDAKIYVYKTPVATQHDVASVKVVKSADGRYFVIDLTFTKEGAKKMADATEKNIAKRLAIMLDGKVICAPMILSQISEQVRVTGNFDEPQAKKLAASIKPEPDLETN